MEIAGDIEVGSLEKLRKEAKKNQSHSAKNVQLLANAMAPIIGLDEFLAKPCPQDLRERALEDKPVLIMCSDEERKQHLVQTM